MKRILAVIPSLILLAGCPQATTTQTVITNNNITPGGTVDLVESAASALNCSPDGIVWSLQESANPGFQSPRDGVVSPAGQYTAPQCGSIYIGTLQHVVAYCVSNGLSGVITMAVAEEGLGAVAIDTAVANPGTPQACLLLPVAQGLTCPGAPSPCANPAGCYCVQINQQVQFYARLDFTCGPVYSPSLPSPLPANCL